MSDVWMPRPAVAVLGGSLKHTEQQVHAGFRVGYELAKRGRTVVTGATTGIPYAAALGARQAGGLVVGVSPADSQESHISSGRPHQQADFMLYTGLGAEGRGPLIIRSAPAAIFIGGEFGTLEEFCTAWLCGCPFIGVLEGQGGIADALKPLIGQVTSSWGSEVIHDQDATALAAAVSNKIDGLKLHQDPETLGSDVREILGEKLE